MAVKCRDKGKQWNSGFSRPFLAQGALVTCVSAPTTIQHHQKSRSEYLFNSSLLPKPGIAILNAIAQSCSIFLDSNNNHLVKAVFKPVIYDHFCTGTTKSEIQRTASKSKNIGYSVVVLCYGKEFDPTKT
jgi:hypothetical protein